MLDIASVFQPSRRLRLLCIGAHSDDLEIGCFGTLASWLRARVVEHVTWMVLSAKGERAAEARRSARALLRGVPNVDVRLGEFEDGFLPARYRDVKTFFEDVKRGCNPHLILTHRLEDRHQDHRLAGELTWNTWRNHLVLEYEIPKYEGDLGQPNVFVPIEDWVMRRKTSHLARYFGSQRSKSWFNAENFLAIARLRGLECRSPSGFAEAFHARKLTLDIFPSDRR